MNSRMGEGQVLPSSVQRTQEEAVEATGTAYDRTTPLSSAKFTVICGGVRSS